MNEQIYGVADASFGAAGVEEAMFYREDRGDGFIAAVDSRVPPVQLLGLWLAELHQRLRIANEDLAQHLGLRVGMHVGPVHQGEKSVAGGAMDFVCGLVDAAESKELLARSGQDLLCVVSDDLYRAVVRHGGRFVEPSAYRSRTVRLKGGPTIAWFHVPGGSVPPLSGGPGPETASAGAGSVDSAHGGQGGAAPRQPAVPTSTHPDEPGAPDRAGNGPDRPVSAVRPKGSADGGANGTDDADDQDDPWNEKSSEPGERTVVHMRDNSSRHSHSVFKGPVTFGDGTRRGADEPEVGR
ncbi:hypothetical protein [Streptomyces sp. SPB162]|uniref:hypothetical protein n=1 Tax=Streptomyces sp. SPB162 TaxID=2940560 RepID=UPI0024063E98|nr:hypothetical protein [Streptomyces sp. SPB162]